MKNVLKRYSLITVILVLVLAVPLAGAGCTPEKSAPPSPGLDLSQTLVPDTDLDIYLYLRQENPTAVPKELLGSRADLSVVSLALWGVPAEEDFSFGGALTLASTEEAALVHSQLGTAQDFRTLLSGRTIYFVEGNGAAAGKLWAAISDNKFKRYEDEKVLTQITAMPDGDDTGMAAVGISKPSPKLLDRILADTGEDLTEMVRMFLNLGQIEVIAAGLYAPGELDLAELVRRGESGNFREMEIGVLALVKSGLPGLVVQTAVARLLESSRFTAITLGDITVYRGVVSFEGEREPVLVRVIGNRVYLAMSSQEAYARTLIAGIRVLE